MLDVSSPAVYVLAVDTMRACMGAGDGVTDPEEFLSDWQSKVDEQTARTTELSRRLQEVRATAATPGREVEVTVDHTGGLAGLSLSPAALGLAPDDLAEAILATSRRAQALLAARMSELVTEIYGEGSQTAGFIGEAYAEKFPAPPEEEPDRGQPTSR